MTTNTSQFRCVIWDIRNPAANRPLSQILTWSFFIEAGIPIENDEQFFANVHTLLHRNYRVRRISCLPRMAKIYFFVELNMKAKRALSPP